MVAEAEFEGKVDFDSAIRPKVIVSRIARSVRFLPQTTACKRLGQSATIMAPIDDRRRDRNERPSAARQ
jgi:hypothetical protein